MKTFLVFYYFIVAVILVSAQNRNRSVRRRSQNASQEPEGQGRTLGILRPLLGLGTLGGVRIGYDQPVVPYRPVRRPQSSVRPQSDYYGGGYGGGYGSYPYYGYGGYGYRPGYGGFIPQYAGYPSYGYGGYRPTAYPAAVGNYGGNYPAYNSQRPNYGGAAGISPSRPVPPVPSNVGSTTGSSPTPSLAGLDPAQAAQIANLLGQLLGSQLRPLLGAAGANIRGDAPDTLV
ncbi:pupal cuticle protein Edg-91-like [Musca vetustissima]|uniref:pupal cuticle protein Edg-91-like n=1 Tax=Musca vetustissima TaxID=27455 RepID=UPI002AB68A11|nr:pupal cuticle protein Edg-91-like [Musca vetustissima]